RRLSKFDEKKDGLNAYVMRFERLASGQMWPREHCATALSVFLAGEALGVFFRLTPTEPVECDNLKKALLQRFRLTADGFRDKLRGAKAEKGETCTQYAARFSSLFGPLDLYLEAQEQEPARREEAATVVAPKGSRPTSN
ncbi:hypothetical protein HPB47_013214, partial [Ixodes persulcatus]